MVKAGAREEGGADPLTAADAESLGDLAIPSSYARRRRWIPSGFTPAFEVLGVRDFRLLFQGTTIGSVGFWMQQVVFGWLVLELTNSPFYLGVASFARYAPMMIVSPLAGVLADRWDRRRIVFWVQLAQLVLTAWIAVVVVSGTTQLWHLLLNALLMGVLISISNPARQALIPSLVGKARLANALAMYSMSMNVSRIIGPSIAGGLIGLVGPGGTLAVQSAGYALAALNVQQMRYTPETARRSASASMRRHLLEGFRYCAGNRSILLQLLTAAIPTILAAHYLQFLPAFARDVYGVGPTGLGVLMTCLGVGALGGSLAIASRRQIERKSQLTLLFAGGYGLSLCGFAAAPALPLAGFFLALAGATNALYSTLNSTLLQEHCPDEYRGRVTSVYVVTWGLMPVGALPAGAIAEIVGVQATVVASGALCALFAFGMLAGQWRARRGRGAVAPRRASAGDPEQ
jgi:MFS transporter, DHA1 family, staphyloferrin A biosynthesis exporter